MLRVFAGNALAFATGLGSGLALYSWVILKEVSLSPVLAEARELSKRVSKLEEAAKSAPKA